MRPVQHALPRRSRFHRILGLATVSALAAGPALLTVPAAPAAVRAVPVAAAADPADTVSLTVDGDDIRVGNREGLPFKGIGLVSGNSTSNLLLDYKAEHPDKYWEMIRTLFGGPYPTLRHVKIEMGTDTNNSTGADAATMRTSDELAVASRSPGFQLAADAKTVQPALTVSILRWNMPAWVQGQWDSGSGKEPMYRWYKETILDAWQKYGYVVDYIDPDRNETDRPDTAFVKWFANRIAGDTNFSDARYGIPAAQQAAVAKSFHAIKIIASDENQTKLIGPAMLTDPALFDAVDVAGYHYNTDDRLDGTQDSATYQPYTKLATGATPTGQDKQVWYSEGAAPFGSTLYRLGNNDGAGGTSTGIGGVQSALDIANRIVKGYVKSKRTLYLFQPAIGSFYEGAQYSHKELVSARDPWSGYISYDPSLAVMEHFTKFARTGWENSTNTAGIWRTVPEASDSGVSGTQDLNGSNGAPSYLTLAAPDRTDFSTVMVNDSDRTKTYRISTAHLSLGTGATGEVWESAAPAAGSTDVAAALQNSMLRFAGTVSPGTDGVWTVTVKPRSIVTFTTLQRTGDADLTTSLPSSGPRTVLDTDSTGRTANTTDTTLYADDFQYQDEQSVAVGVDNGARTVQQPYLQSRGNQPRYLVDQTGAWEVGPAVNGNRLLLQQMDSTMAATKGWNPAQPATVLGDFRWQNYTAAVDVSFPDKAGGTASIGIRQQQGMTLSSAAYSLRLTAEGSWSLYRHTTAISTGAVAAGSHRLTLTGAGATITAAVDGRVVATYVDPQPEPAGRVVLGSGFTVTGFDNLKIDRVPGLIAYATDLVDNMDPRVKYTGTWRRAAAYGNAMDWFRTTATTSTAGASVSLTFNGTGIDLIGGNTGKALLDVSVDGRPVARGAATLASDRRLPTYSLRGLTNGNHTVQVTVRSGTFVLDALSVNGSRVSGSVSVTPLRNAVSKVGSPRQTDFSAATWAVFDATRSAAQSAAAGQEGLDTIGVNQLVDRLLTAFGDLRPDNLSTTTEELGLIGAVTPTGPLPSTVTVAGAQRAITWAPSSATATRTPYEPAKVTGWTTQPLSTGVRQSISATVQVSPPDPRYLVDAGLSDGQTSPQYLAVAQAFALLNDRPDRIVPNATGWGHVAGGLRTKAGTDPADLYSTGLWAESGRTIRYQFALPAGSYELTAGFRDWWSRTRPMSQDLRIPSGAGSVTTPGAGITLSASTPQTTGTVRFTLTRAATVTYSVAKSGSQDPVISWIGVARRAG